MFPHGCNPAKSGGGVSGSDRPGSQRVRRSPASLGRCGASNEPMKTRPPTRLLTTYLDVMARLQHEAEVPKVDAMSSEFLDIAQSVEHQELARLRAARLADRAKRLREALTRATDGEYGVCSECGAAIPARRLRALPDATTCVKCQEGLERVRS